MALLDMHEWYDFARDTNWTPTYVAEDLIGAEKLVDFSTRPDVFKRLLDFATESALQSLTRSLRLVM